MGFSASFSWYSNNTHAYIWKDLDFPGMTFHVKKNIYYNGIVWEMSFHIKVKHSCPMTQKFRVSTSVVVSPEEIVIPWIMFSGLLWGYLLSYNLNFLRMWGMLTKLLELGVLEGSWYILLSFPYQKWLLNTKFQVENCCMLI